MVGREETLAGFPTVCFEAITAAKAIELHGSYRGYFYDFLLIYHAFNHDINALGEGIVFLRFEKIF